MKANWIRLATMCGLLLGASAPNGRGDAQEPPAQAPAPAHEWLVWTGRTRQADGSLRAEVIRPTLAKDLRKELARIQVAADVERRFEDSLRELGVLAIQASRRGYAERKDLLVEIALARATVLSKLGKHQAALEALERVFVDSAQALDDSQLELAPAVAEDLEVSEAARKDPRVAALRAQLQSGAKSAPRDGGDKIAKIVVDAVDHGQPSQSFDLGERAIPTLVQMVVKDLDSLPQVNFDPLTHLAGISQVAAAELILARFDEGGALWKTRILRLMRDHSVFQDANFGGNGERTFLRTPEWRAVLERLIEEPTTTRESVLLCGRLARFDLVSPSLQRSLVRLLNAEDADMARFVEQVLLGYSGRESLRPVLAGVLSSPHAEVRATAAEELLLYDSTPELFASASHADPAVRVVVARALRIHDVRKFNPADAGDDRESSRTPTLGEAERAILTQLSADPDAEVRAAATSAIANLSEPLGDAVYARLALDKEPRVRAALLYARLPVEAKVKLAANLATDSDASVLRSFDQFLFALVNELRSSPGAQLDVRYVPVLDARVRNASSPFPSSRGDSTIILEQLAQSREGLQTILRWSLEDRSPHATAELLDRIAVLSRREGGMRYPRPVHTAQEVGIPFTPVQLREFFEKVAGTDLRRLPKLTEALALLRDDLAPQFLPIAADPMRPLVVRAQALQIAAGSARQPMTVVVKEVLLDERWQTSGSERDGAEALAGTGYLMDREQAASVLEQVLAQKSPAMEAWNAFARGYVDSKPLEASTADAILALWSNGGVVQRQVVGAALKQVATRPRAAQGDWLLLGLRDNLQVADTLQLIGELRDPSYLPVLEGMLASDYPLESFKGNPAESRMNVIYALTRYFDDAAAEILLEAAGSTPHPAVRDGAFAALETIRKYRAEKGRWEELQTSKEATAAAVRELVALLDDSNPGVRAQAARGLGTLRAFEQMPRLVRLLKDGDESVRKAASEALGVLNTPAKQD